MERNTIAEMKEILEAIEQGKPIEWYDSIYKTWRDLDINNEKPNFNFIHRIKPKEPKKKLLTNRELAKWLAKGNGEYTREEWNDVYATYTSYIKKEENKPVDDRWLIRKWDDEEWHKPTREYAFGEEDA